MIRALPTATRLTMMRPKALAKGPGAPLLLAGLLAASLPAVAVPALADPAAAYLMPAPHLDAAGQCRYFARLHRFTEESKSMCDDGRQVKPGPVTSHILDGCAHSQPPGWDNQPVEDWMTQFVDQIRREGEGNACHEIKAQAWDLVEQ